MTNYEKGLTKKDIEERHKEINCKLRITIKGSRWWTLINVNTMDNWQWCAYTVETTIYRVFCKCNYLCYSAIFSALICVKALFIIMECYSQSLSLSFLFLISSSLFLIPCLLCSPFSLLDHGWHGCYGWRLMVNFVKAFYWMVQI